IRALIVDDEPIARRRIKRLLASEADIQVAGECGDGRSAIEAIRTLAPDLVFLDVQMPEADGFAVVRTIGDSMPAVVFVTAFDEYAVAAFEVHALDYLLKPFNQKRFYRTVKRARQHLVRHGDSPLGGLLQELNKPARYLTRFVVRTSGRIRLIESAQIDWIE